MQRAGYPQQWSCVYGENGGGKKRHAFQYGGSIFIPRYHSLHRCDVYIINFNVQGVRIVYAKRNREIRLYIVEQTDY